MPPKVVVIRRRMAPIFSAQADIHRQILWNQAGVADLSLPSCSCRDDLSSASSSSVVTALSFSFSFRLYSPPAGGHCPSSTFSSGCHVPSSVYFVGYTIIHSNTIPSGCIVPVNWVISVPCPWLTTLFFRLYSAPAGGHGRHALVRSATKFRRRRRFGADKQMTHVMGRRQNEIPQNLVRFLTGARNWWRHSAAYDRRRITEVMTIMFRRSACSATDK